MAFHPELVAVTGATGQLGSEVVSRIRRANFPVRALVRDVRKAEAFDWDDVDIQPFDFLDLSSYQKALEKVQRLILITPTDEALSSFLGAARKAGVEQVVAISGMNVEPEDDTAMGRIERTVYASGLTYTVLRLNWFMQNFVTHFRDDIKLRHCIELPAGDAKTSFVDVRDVSDVIVKTLIDLDEHGNRVYTLTGPEAISHADVAKAISEALEREVRYKAISDKEASEKFKQMGFGDGGTHEMLRLFRDIRDGKTEETWTDIKYVTGQEPRPFEIFVKDHYAFWK